MYVCMYVCVYACVCRYVCMCVGRYVCIRGGSTGGGQGGRPLPQPEHWGGIAPPTLGYYT